MKVYEGNWSGKDRPNMIQRIKQKQKEIDHDIVIRMFENLKGRIQLAKESGDGLSSLRFIASPFMSRNIPKL